MDTASDSAQRTRRIYRVTLIGTVGNALLVAFKFVAGILGRSDAMLADAAHSLSDFVTDIIVLAFVRISGKPQDSTHDFGHGKYETLATAIIGIMLLAAGGGILWKSCAAIWAWAHGAELAEPGMIALIAALVSIVVKELLYQITVREGRRLNSPAVIANAWHHRSDALSSIGAAIGIGGAIVLGKHWHVLDPLAGAVVSIFIVRVAIKMLGPTMDELLERSLPEDVRKQIIKTASSFPRVIDPHNLRTRKVGQRRVVDLHVRMPADMTISESHAIVTDMEREMRKYLGADAIITIHVEPLGEIGSKNV